MSEITAWRGKSFQISLALVLINPVYFLIGINLVGHLHFSDRIWGNMIAMGVFVGIISIVCGLIGQGPRKWLLPLVASVETFIWWFMAVGL